MSEKSGVAQLSGYSDLAPFALVSLVNRTNDFKNLKYINYCRYLVPFKHFEPRPRPKPVFGRIR